MCAFCTHGIHTSKTWSHNVKHAHAEYSVSESSVNCLKCSLVMRRPFKQPNLSSQFWLPSLLKKA